MFTSSCSLFDSQFSEETNNAGNTNNQSEVKSSTLSHQGYKLVWSDEFSGNELDSNNWGYETGPRWYNSERQAYTDKNVTVKNGMLRIEAKKDNYPDQQGSERYTSSRLLTQGKQSWKYGIFEARLKRPKGEGSFPAFWMMGNSYSRQEGNWPACGEISVFPGVIVDKTNSSLEPLPSASIICQPSGMSVVENCCCHFIFV